MANYIGQDTFPASAPIPDDATPPKASEVNPIIEAAMDRTIWLFNRYLQAITVPALNWKIPLVPVAATYSPAVGHAVFSPAGNRDNWQAVAYARERNTWLVASAIAGGTLEVFSSLSGETFAIVDAALVDAVPATTIDEIHKLIPSGIGAANANRTLALVVQTLGATHRIVVFTHDVGGVWTASALLDAYGAGGVAKRADGIRSLVAGGFVAGVGVNAGLASVVLQTSADGITWTDRTGSLPGGITANCPSWGFAESATRLLAVPRGGAQNAYVRSDDGITWTAGSLGAVGGTEVASAVGYGTLDRTSNGFIVAIASVAGNTRFLRSADGITWTAVAQTLTGVAVSDLIALGSLWVAVSEQTDRSGTILYSVDGGLTWMRTKYGFSDNVAPGSAMYVRPKIAASEDGFASVNSKILRFSLESGLTSQIT